MTDFETHPIGTQKRLEAADVIFHLLERYRRETPLGNQPHMIAGEADEALALYIVRMPKAKP